MTRLVIKYMDKKEFTDNEKITKREMFTNMIQEAVGIENDFTMKSLHIFGN